MDARGTVLRRPAARGLVLLTLILGWCLGLIAVRVLRTGQPHYLFLIWNLFLACVPLASSRALTAARRRGASPWAQGILVVLWLLFLPNAPYIVTDLVHLSSRGGMIFWYDLGMLFSCAAAGLLLGYLSVLDVQHLVEDTLGKAAGWLVAGGALMLAGFGVYMGRAMRWNSWDVVLDPIGLFGSVADLLLNPRLYPRAWAITLLFGAGLLLGYATLYVESASRRRSLRQVHSREH
jgi:uncharacterized membrane protein